jgi:hypothetical protein
LTRVRFTDKPNDSYIQNLLNDTIVVNHGADLSEYSGVSYSDDIIGADRQDGLWDIGAYELSSVDSISEDLILPMLRLSVYSNAAQYFAPGEEPYRVFYLRNHFKPESAIAYNGYQSDDMVEISRVISNTDGFDIKIYVEAGEKFEGTFDLGVHANRTLDIQTDQDDYLLIKQPAAIEYTGSLLSAGSLFETVSINSLIIAPKLPDDVSVSLLSSTSGTSDIVIRNCIIVVPGDKLVNLGVLNIRVVNSYLLFRRRSGESELSSLFITSSGDANLWNTLVAGYSTSDIELVLIDGSPLGTIRNSNIYNYGSGSQLFNVIDISDSISSDPIMKEFSISESLWDTGEVVNLNFIENDILKFEQASDSSMVNVGGNDYTDSLSVDIIGRQRIFPKRVDIGPFEPEVYSIEFSSGDIRSIFQDKLRFIGPPNTKCFVSLDENKVYKEIVSQFASQIVGTSVSVYTEFTRESKIFIELSQLKKDRVFNSDKPRKLIASFEAYIDHEHKTIVFFKSKFVFGDMLNEALQSDQYIFQFNEAEHRLYVYLSDTYDKGLSGSRSAVKNVRFGGNSVL